MTPEFLRDPMKQSGHAMISATKACDKTLSYDIAKCRERVPRTIHCGRSRLVVCCKLESPDGRSEFNLQYQNLKQRVARSGGRNACVDLMLLCAWAVHATEAADGKDTLLRMRMPKPVISHWPGAI